MPTAITTRSAGIVLAIVLVATGCGDGGSTPDGGDGGYFPDPVSFEPGPGPSEDVSQAATEFGKSQLDFLLDGRTAPPSSISWADITSGQQLPVPQKTAFCQALATPGADNALSSILAAGLSALSMRLRKRPLSSDAEAILGFAVTFATNTCPAWNPAAVRFATPVPIEAWYPAGYQPMILNPGVAWRWAETDTFACDTGEGTSCYGLKVATREGCGRLEGTIATYDAEGVVREFITDTKLDLQVLTTTLVFGFSDNATVDAAVMSIACV